MYAPAVMILVIIVFVIYSIMAFFTGGSVPIPSIPDIEVPTMTNIASNITNTINNAKNTINNAKNTISNELNLTNKRNNNNSTILGSIMGNNNTNKGNNTNKKNNANTNGFRKSMLETI
jgi:hypothetical protein